MSLNDETGHILVDSLVALVIISVLLLPLSGLFRIIYQNMPAEKLETAIQITKNEMEKTLADCLYSNENKIISINNSDWLVSRKVKHLTDLYLITITTKNERNTKWQFTLKTWIAITTTDLLLSD